MTPLPLLTLFSRWRQRGLRVAVWPVALAGFALFAGCAQLPAQVGRKPSVALRDTGDTHLGRVLAPLARANPGESGVVAIPQAIDAFAARARLADVAERSLDLQYYIWQDDLSGKLLFDSVRRAADRGVRVRLLLDDNGTAGLDPVLAGLAAHRNIEVRLFNPFTWRRWRFMGYLTDFGRLNRRMHNKSFTADNQVSIVGGRNIGDEYFGAGQDLQFVDLDVMAVGDVVHQVSDDFDRYWASDSAYPAERILGPASGPPPSAEVEVRDDALSAAYLDAIRRDPFVREMVEQRLSFEWGQVSLVSDDASKGEGEARDDQLLWSRLKRIMPVPQQQLELVSPYFVPGAEGVEHFVELAERGVKVTILTNSLAATDVAAVHAGYAKRRIPLLEGGVDLFEMKRGGSASSASASGATASPHSTRTIGSSAASLHAKTFVVDRKALFVGSFNFDPRSARLNTELGFVIKSPPMAAAVSDAITGSLAQRAYRVRLAPTGRSTGRLQWVEHVGPDEVVYDEEPRAGWWRKLEVDVLAWLPIDWLL